MTATLALRAADLLFDEATHTSKTPDGRAVPHVTHILAAVGVSTDFEALGSMSRDLAETIAYRRALGSAVHADLHAYDDDDLDLQHLADSPTRPYVEAWATFRRHLRLTPVSRERRIFNPRDWYTGKYDGIFIQDGDWTRRILIDTKIGDPEDSGCRFQLAAYAGAHLLEHPDQPIHERWGVQLAPEKPRNPYVLFPYTTTGLYPDHWHDYRKFQCFCVTYREQAARRRAA